MNGQDQLTCFNKILNWPKKKIKVKSSTRSLKNKKIFMGNKIYFPMTIRNESQVYESFSYIINSNKFYISGLEIKKHPVSAKEKKVLRFEKKIKKIIIK